MPKQLLKFMENYASLLFSHVINKSLEMGLDLKTNTKAVNSQEKIFNTLV